MLKKKSIGWEGLSTECRNCRNARYRKWYSENRDYAIERATESTKRSRDTPEGQELNRKWAREAKRRLLADPIEREKHNARGREWTKANPDRVRQFKHQHPAIKRMRAAKSVAIELNAVPAWLTAEHKRHIECIYAIADFLTRKIGTNYEVDHYYPLNGDQSCGLHVPWNLRVITQVANKIKGNRLPT
jgi:hypothetical protein